MDWEKVDQALNGLGKDSDEVYRNLLFGGYKGVHSCASCPVAQFLTRNFPPGPEGAWKVYGHGFVELWGDGDRHLSREVPEPVLVFINRFDNLEFQELVPKERDD
jgi:hypothetical protein